MSLWTAAEGAGACISNAECTSTVENVTSSIWDFPSNAPIVRNGITYGYHALERMMPPGFGGRGIPPSVVQDVIINGERSQSKIDPTAVEIVLDNVMVVINEATQKIITIHKLGSP